MLPGEGAAEFAALEAALMEELAPGPVGAPGSLRAPDGPPTSVLGASEAAVGAPDGATRGPNPARPWRPRVHSGPGSWTRRHDQDLAIESNLAMSAATDATNST